MNVKFLNPFVEAAFEVFEAEVSLKARRGDLALAMDKSPFTTDDVTVVISLVGEVKGVVLYGLSQSTALAIVGRILGHRFLEFDELAQSGIAELGNVITGRASVKLENAGYHANISPPVLVRGKNAMISTLDLPRLIVPMESELGTLTVHLALREAPIYHPHGRPLPPTPPAPQTLIQPAPPDGRQA